MQPLTKISLASLLIPLHTLADTRTLRFRFTVTFLATSTVSSVSLSHAINAAPSTAPPVRDSTSLASSKAGLALIKSASLMSSR